MNTNVHSQADLKLTQVALTLILRPETQLRGNEVVAVYKAADLLSAILNGEYLLVAAEGKPSEGQ
jgi:hypothetical protein